jgi:aspartate aminotransferase
MSSITRAGVDLSGFMAAEEGSGARVSTMAQGLVGSEILRIAGEIRALREKGATVCDLTVGDFAPRHFPIPARLLEDTRAALERGETNYPPAAGMPELRA